VCVCVCVICFFFPPFEGGGDGCRDLMDPEVGGMFYLCAAPSISFEV